MKSDLKHFEDFKVGEVISLAAYSVTRDAIIAFAQEFDPQDFHLDEAAAKSSVLGGLAASGWHVSAILMRMIVDSWLNKTESMGSNHIQEMRWLKPVFPGDILSGSLTIEAARVSSKRPEMGIFGVRVKLFDQHQIQKTEMVATIFMKVLWPC